MKRKSASKKLLPLMLILGISMPANAVEVKDTSQNIYNVVQNSDGTYTITVKDGNAYKNLETGKVALFSAKEMGTDTDIALKVQNITKVKLSGSVAVTIPDVSCKLDAGFSWGKIEVKHFIASVTGKADFEGGLYISGVNSEQQIKHASGTMETVSDVLELGRVPIKLGTTGLSADLVVSLFYDVSGQFVVKYSVEATGGYEFKDGNGRFIHDFSQTLTPVTIEGSAKCGLQFGLNLTALETWDLAGIDIKVGPAAKASVSYTVRDAGNVLCSDVRTYIYAAGELNPDTVVGKFLKTVWHYTLSKDFLFDDDDNPLKLKVHFENGTLVDKCTVGAGSIEGSVLDSNSKALVKNASVEAYSGKVKVEKTFTKEDRTYSFNDLDEGTYKIVVTATGYQKYESSSMEVSANQITYAESFLMVSRAEAGDGELSGRFIHSMTGGNIENVTYELRKGWDVEDNSGIISEAEALEIIRNSEKKAEEESSEELNMSSEEGKTDDNTEEEIFDDSSEEPEISESGDTAEVIEFPKDSETEEENDGTEITEEDSESAEELPVEDIYEESEELGLAG
ncbi:carboxypeptidase-like regulatory domain-containing protein [Blautia sp.]|uniref:carboxypeptidase-like regulatory domain-containing protein n=1 Tax=Blautia sp. TaxID=1955243 RepID=UPI003AB210A4